MAKKAKPKKAKPTPGEKANSRARLVAKGVPRAKAKELTGEDEDLTREEIAARRIAWQRGLPKA